MMPPSQSQAPQKRRRWPLILIGVFFGLIILGSASFVVASALEEQDTFCIACHVAPERTYFNRAYIALDNPTLAVTDLSTAHYHVAQQKGTTTPFACIDCHRGDSSLGNRVSTLALGGRDALIFLLGREDATLEKDHISTAWLPNASCVNCHTETLITLNGLKNHFHTHLPQAAAAAKGKTLLLAKEISAANRADVLNVGLKTIDVPLLCTSCHQAHKTLPTGATNFFMEVDRRNAACVQCHQTAKEGPQDVKNLPGGSK